MEHNREEIAASARLLEQAEALRKFSRRKFLVGTSISSLLAADMLFTRRVQTQRRVTAILPVQDDFADSYHSNASWFLFPGFKTSWEEAQWILNSLRGALNKRARLAAVGYSNVGLEVSDVVAALLAYVEEQQITTLYFYGHSFGGMLATQVAVQLREEHGIEVAMILLDSTPCTRNDVLDQSWFDGVVFLYESGFRVPSVLRGSYELGERVIHKNERTWRQILDQSLEQLSPIAPSSVLVQTESAYIFHFEAAPLAGRLGQTKMAYLGSPADTTVRYFTASAAWATIFAQNMVSAGLQTTGARPAHASPQWNPFIYRPLITQILDESFPLPKGSSPATAF